MATQRITVEPRARPIAQVWHEYTTPDDIVQSNAASPDWHTTRASVDLREGGASPRSDRGPASG